MKYRTAYPNELYHHGILGMKWGVRRYQNYDGTRIGTGGAPVIKPSSLKGGVQRVGTGGAQRSSMPKALKKSVVGGQGGKAEGNARLAAKAPNPYFERSVKQGKGKEDITPAEKIAKDTRSASESSKKLVEAVERHDPKLKEKKAAAERSQAQKAKKMSDKELRDNINRIKMEREYVSLTTKETSSGYDKVKEVLSVVGDVAGVVLALVSIYATIKSVKKLKQSGIDDSDEEALMHSMLEDGDYDDEFISHAIALDDEYVADYIDDFLEHHGIKGQKWGVRRFQNYDGTRISTGSGVGGGGGGSSKKVSLSSKFKNSTLGGQGGKAKGTAKLAAKLPNHNLQTESEKSKQLYKDLEKAGSWEKGVDVVKKNLSKEDIDNLNKKMNTLDSLKEKAFSQEEHDENVKLLNQYDIDYMKRQNAWAINDLKQNYKNDWEIIKKEAKEYGFSPADHEIVEQHGYEYYQDIEEYNPPQTNARNSYEEAIRDFNKETMKITKRMVGEYGSQTVSGIGEVESYVDETIKDILSRR